MGAVKESNTPGWDFTMAVLTGIAFACVITVGSALGLMFGLLQ